VTLEIPTVELVSISQALVVAEHRSFHRAAKVLHMQQSAISRRVRALEDRLGVSLFERSHAGVRVTAAGARFFEQARVMLLQLDCAVKMAGAAGRGSIGHVRIGIGTSIAAGFLREVIREYRAQHGDVEIEVVEGAAVEHIREGRVDVSFMAGTPEAPSCMVLPLWTERIFIALPRRHVLCERHRVDWLCLRGEHFIVAQSAQGRAFHDYIISRFAEFGCPPLVQRLEVSRETLMHLVALRVGVSPICEADTATSFPEVEFRRLTGDSDVLSYSAVWSPHNDNPAFRRFLSLAHKSAKRGACRRPHGPSA
jgi:DNA-binding transcriptional LysR family regulator